MKNKEVEEEFVSGTFRWRIDNFSKLKHDRHYSNVFVIGGLKWRMLIWPKGNDVNLVDKFSMYLGVADASTLPSGWTTHAHVRLVVVNQLDSKKSVTRPTKGNPRQEFKENKSELGYRSFMPPSELYDCSKGYLVNDVCIVEATVDVPVKIKDQGTVASATMEFSSKQYIRREPSNVHSVQDPDSSAPKTPCSELMPPSNKQNKRWEPSNVQSVQAPDSSAAPEAPCSELVPPFQDAPGSEQVCIKPADDSPADPSLMKKGGKVPAIPTGELMDFRGLGLIEKAFVPLLEEVCSWHPSLIKCQQKQSRLITECAFTALGRLLHLLKTTKVKDMTLDACERLEIFWSELKIFKFELAWLDPHVQSALSMEKFVRRVGRMKRLREDVEVLENEIKRCLEDLDVLENEIKRRRATLADAEVDVDVAKRYLAMVEEDINEIDMDSELGFGRC